MTFIQTARQASALRIKGWLAGPQAWLAGPQAWLAGPQAWLDGPEGERTDQLKISPFYRTYSPMGAAALIPLLATYYLLVLFVTG